MAGRPWTKAEELRVQAEARSGLTRREIAALHKRTPGAISLKMHGLGLSCEALRQEGMTSRAGALYEELGRVYLVAKKLGCSNAAASRFIRKAGHDPQAAWHAEMRKSG